MDIWVSNTTGNKFEEVHRVAKKQKALEDEKKRERLILQQAKEVSRSYRKIPKENLIPSERKETNREFIKIKVI